MKGSNSACKAHLGERMEDTHCPSHTIKCLDFHRNEWKDRPLYKYYVKMRDGRIFERWAHDSVDACDSVDDGSIIEYGHR